MARVTYAEGPGLRKTSITLQDGCFGAGALMRIAALFVRPDRGDSVQGDSDIEVQAVPVAAAANATSMPEPSATVSEATQPRRYGVGAYYPRQRTQEHEDSECCSHVSTFDALIACAPHCELHQQRESCCFPEAISFQVPCKGCEGASSYMCCICVLGLAAAFALATLVR